MPAHAICLTLVVLAVSTPSADEEGGSIGGHVINATRGGEPVAGTEVLLQARSDEGFEVIARAVTESQGRFLFEGVPLDEGLIYLVGATQDGISNPSPRSVLSPERPDAQIVLTVHEATSGKNPLLIRDYLVQLTPEPGALRVTETLWIENPLPLTYRGPDPGDAGAPERETLQLRISPAFERVTFHKEFYGRQFSIRNGKLVTGIPWTPGVRELTFTYVLRNDSSKLVWTRPLDLPCRRVRVSVRTDRPEGVRCNLGGPPTQGRDGSLTFVSEGGLLPLEYPIEVELGPVPVDLMAHARWVILAVLLLAIGGTCLILAKRKRAANRRVAQPPQSPSPHVKRRPARSGETGRAR